MARCHSYRSYRDGYRERHHYGMKKFSKSNRPAHDVYWYKGGRSRSDSRDRSRHRSRSHDRGRRDHRKGSRRRDRSRRSRRYRRDCSRSRSRRSRRSRGGRRDRDRRRSYREDRHRKRSASHRRHHRSERTRCRDRDRRKRSQSSTVYSSSDSESRGSSSNDDEIVHFDWRKDMMLSSRYRVEKLLGDGTFGRVLGCTDTKERRDVAVKVIRDVKRYVENAKIEADILKEIRRVDPDGSKSRSAIMFDSFEYGKHYCLAMQTCGVSLYDFIKDNDFQGFWMQDIQSFSQQSLEGLDFLKSRLKMTHTDLKPENILLESAIPPQQSDFPRHESWRKRKTSPPKGTPYMRPACTRIKLIDFGNATYESEHHSSIINTRQYRGPEVILSHGWDERSDIWSIGCILMELYTGELLFGTHENLEHLHLMERILEPLPQSQFSCTPEDAKDKFMKKDSRSGSWQLKDLTPKSASYVRSQVTLKEIVEPHHIGFASFVAQLLTLEKTKRPQAADALKLPFLSKKFDD